MKIKITADSTVDLSKQILDKHNISTIALCVLIGDRVYRDTLDINANDIFDKSKYENATCTTSALNSTEYKDFFETFLEDYDHVIHISVSSKLSSCFANACEAAKALKNVSVFDSQNLSTAQGIIAIKAAEMAKEQLRPEDILKKCKELTKKVHISFVVDTLEYLKKSGRCSALTEFGANLLKIKPSIHMINGELKVNKKYRGNFEKCLEQYIKDNLCNNESIDDEFLFLTYSPCSKEVLDQCMQQIKKYKNFNNIYLANAGCTISSHCGPNCVGLIYINK